MTPHQSSHSDPIASAAVARPLPARCTMHSLRSLAAAGRFPVTILVLLEQMGGFSLGGALSRTGCVFELVTGIRYRHPDADFDCSRYGTPAKWVSSETGLDYSVGLSFPVNGKEGEQWIEAVTYEPGDLYRVWLWAKRDSETGGRKLLCGPVEAADFNLIAIIDEVYVGSLKAAGEIGIPDVDQEVVAD